MKDSEFIQNQIDTNTVRGLYDRSAKHGPITGSGPGFDDAMKAFRLRQKELARRGKWRKNITPDKTDDGSFIDPDWYIYDYSH